VTVLERQVRVEIVYKLRVYRFFDSDEVFKWVSTQNSSKIKVLKITKHHSPTRYNNFIMDYEKSVRYILWDEGVGNDSEIFPFSDLDLLDMLKIMHKNMARGTNNENKQE